MDQKLKERVFGALVVVAIAVIFVPMILDNKHDEALNISEAIPTPPAEAVAFAEPPPAVVEMEERLTPVELEQATADIPNELAVSQEIVPAVPVLDEAPIASVEQMPVIEPKVIEPKVMPKIAKAEVKPEAKVEAINIAGWAVQMGTFSSHDNAKALERKLKDKGYSVFLSEVNNNNQKLTRVLVGPEVKREDAAKLVAKIESNLSVKGVVIRYEPLA